MSNEIVIDVRMPVRGDAFFDEEAVMSRLEQDVPDPDTTVSTNPAVTDGTPRVVADAAIHHAAAQSVARAIAADQVAAFGARAGIADLLNAFEPDVIEGPEGEMWERMVVWTEQHGLSMRDHGPFMVTFEGDE